MIDASYPVPSHPNPDEIHGMPADPLAPGPLPAPSALTLLEAPESKSLTPWWSAGADLDRNPTLSVQFRHSGWARNRRLIFESLERTGQSCNRRRQFKYCGSDAYILQSLDNPNKYRIAGSSCHDRFCLPCARERGHAIALNVLERLESKRLRFLTLTLKSDNESLEFLVNKLYTSFRRLRSRAFWQQRVTGGVAFLENTWSDSKQRWHPHFHILIEGSFLPYQQLKKHWYQITGDSHIIDIRLVRDNSTAARYVTKYLSKPFSNTYINRPVRLDEAVAALKHRKLLTTFGDWRGITLRRPPSDEAWTNIGTLEEFILEARRGVSESERVLERLADDEQSTLCQRAPPQRDTSGPPLNLEYQTRMFPDDVLRQAGARRPSQPM